MEEMTPITSLEEYKALVETQVQALMHVLQSVAVGDLSVEVEIPEGIEVLSDLAVGIEIMVEDLQALMAQQVRADLVEKQSHALLDVIQSVAFGDLDVKVQVPEGVEVLSELAVGVEMMIDDLREMMAEQARARAELEESRQQLQEALDEILMVQRRYLREEWDRYTEVSDTSLGYYRSNGEEGPSGEAWLPAMTAAVEDVQVVQERDEEEGCNLAIPLHLYGEIIGAAGFSREDDQPWTEEEIGAAEAIMEQVTLALESQRLFEEEQRARALLGLRVKELDCLNDIGRSIDQAPTIAEFLAWVANRISSAMQFPELAVAAIEFEGEVYGSEQALTLPCQIVQGLQIGGERLGQVYIAYTQEEDFLDEESALLGDITRRVGGYVENRRLFRSTQEALAEARALYRAARLATAFESLADTLQAVVDGVAEALPADQVALYTLNQEHREVTHVVGSGRGYAGGLSGKIDDLSFEELWGGLSGWVLREQKPALSLKGGPDSRENAEAQRRRAKQGLGSIIVVPLIYRGQVLGTLTASNRVESRDFGQRDVDLMVAMANQAAVALENTRLFEEAQLRADEQAILNELGQALAMSQDVDSILNEAYRHVSRLVDTQNYYVALYDAEWDEIFVPFRVLDGVVERPQTPRPAGQGGLTEYLMETRQPLSLAGDIAEQVEALGITSLPLRKGRMSRSWLGAPLNLGEQCLGVMVTLDYASDVAYDARDEALIMAASNQVAIALQNVRLLEESQSRAEEQAVLNEIGQALAASQDVDQVMDQSYRGVRELLGASSFYMTLYDAEMDNMSLGLQAIEGEVSRLSGSAPIARGGLTDHLIQSRQPLLLPDRVQERTAEMGFELIPLQSGQSSASWVGVPILIGDRVLGTMVALSYSRPRAFDTRSQELLVALANHTALALQNVRLLEETRAALAEVEETHRSYLRRGWQEHLRQRDTLERGGFVFDRVRSERPENVESVHSLWKPEMDLALNRRGAGAVVDDEAHRTGLAVPISLRGQTLGVLGVEAGEGERQWTDDDVALIEAIAEQLAQTLESARLFADTQRRAERERLIGEITAKIRASTDIRDILETTANELGRALGTSRALVHLGFEKDALPREGDGGSTREEEG